MSHASIYVTNQAEALDFYTKKLGFEIRTDSTMPNGFRWLTVGPSSQPNFEIILMEPTPGFMYDEATATQLRSLVSKGALGVGIFETADCQKAYEELKSKGVEFKSPPQERPYGIEAVMVDTSGNWLSMVQRR
jgi:predicted enzyme related to lactoylglutathione lyase